MDTLDGIISRGICHSDSNYKEISQQQLQLGELELSHSHPCTVVVSSAKSIRICMMIIRAVWRRHLGVALHAGSGFFSSSSAVSCLVHRGVCPPRPSLSGVTFKWRHGPFIIICSLRLVSSYALFDRSALLTPSTTQAQDELSPPRCCWLVIHFFFLCVLLLVSREWWTWFAPKDMNWKHNTLTFTIDRSGGGCAFCECIPISLSHPEIAQDWTVNRRCD